MSLTGPVTELTNTKAFKYAAECLAAGDRVVGFIMLGDDNISNGGVGFHDGFIRALDNLGYKAYSTGTWGPFANSGVATHLGQWYTPYSLGSGAVWSGLTAGTGTTFSRANPASLPAGLSVYCNGPFGASGLNYLEGLFWNSKFNSAALSAGIQINLNNDLRHAFGTTAAFRAFNWFVQGPSTDTYRFAVKYQDPSGSHSSAATSLFTVYDTSAGTTPLYSATASSYGATYAVTNYTADDGRIRNLRVEHVYPNVDLTGPGCILFSSLAAGATSLSGGYFVSPGVAFPGAQTRLLVDHCNGYTNGLTGVTDEWLDAYLQAQIDLVRANAQSGGSTAGALVFFLSSGMNDYNDNNGSYNPLTLVYNASGASASSTNGWANNTKALINRIMSRTPIRNFNTGKNVCFIVAPSPLLTNAEYGANSEFADFAGLGGGDLGATAAATYISAALTMARDDAYPFVVGANLKGLFDILELPYVVTPTTGLLLNTNVGYYAVASRLLNRLSQCAIGSGGQTTSPWGSTPDQRSRPCFLNDEFHNACIATDNGWEIPIGSVDNPLYEVIVTERGLASRYSQSQDRKAPVIISSIRDGYTGDSYNGQQTNSQLGVSYSKGYFTSHIRFGTLDHNNVRFNSFTGASAISCTFDTGGTHPTWLYIQASDVNVSYNSYQLTASNVASLSGSVAYGTRLPVDLLLTHPDGLTQSIRLFIRTGV